MGMKSSLSTLDVVSTAKPVVRSPRGMLVEIGFRTVPWSSVAQLSARLGVQPAEVIGLIGLAERTALRRQKEGFLKPDEADRLLRVGRVFEDAVRVFGSEEKAAKWLNAPAVAFSGVKPLTLLDCDAGSQIVGDELIRIDFGDFA
jgi:putative toxin-antitoxin system antitoxin component (TIGR02293 family)